MTRELRQQAVLYIVAFSTAALGAGAIYVTASILEVPIKILTRDPYRAMEAPAYSGYFSLLGSAIWLIASTATLTTGIVARAVWRCRFSDTGSYRLVILGGGISLFMALDDILLFHDAFARSVGMPELSFHLLYATSIIAMIVYCRDCFRSTAWPILFAALACFGLSSTVDLWSPASETLNQSEDVFKFSAIILWASYFLHVSRVLVNERVNRS